MVKKYLYTRYFKAEEELDYLIYRVRSGENIIELLDNISGTFFT